MAMDTQFRLLMGDWGIPNFSVLFGGYAIIFIFVVFFTLLNFFLAIIVDSYAKVTEKVGESLIEQNVILDVWSVCKFSLILWREKSFF